MDMRELLRDPRVRHPIHWVAGFISGACLFHPEVGIAITSSVMTFIGFGVYEWWEDRDLIDQGWLDWWEFVCAYYIMAVIVLIKGLI